MVFFVVGEGAFGQGTQAPQLPPGAIIGIPSTQPGAITPEGPPVSFSPGQKFRYSTVQAYMRLPSPLQRGDQILAGMGDEAAADIVKILGTSSSLTAEETLTVLDIVHKAFMVPRAIQNVADRKPVAALALLQKFQSTAVDQLVKERIATETNYLNAVPQVIPPITYSGPIGPPPPPHTIVVN
jgi:hypothetical protein